MKNTSKILMVAAILLVATTLVSATLLTYFGSGTVSVHVTQSVTIAGHDWTQPFTTTLDNVTAGNTYYYDVPINNAADHHVGVAWNYTIAPDSDGISICVSYDGGVSYNPVGNTYHLPVGDSTATFKVTFDDAVAPGDYVLTGYLYPSSI